MKINENAKLILRDIYLYDIESCHYTIMENLGLDVSDINKDDKIERNIQIGKLMRKNPRLTSLLRNTTKSIIDEYIRANNVVESEILLRQYDGIILTRTLRKTDLHSIPLNIRKHFSTFISSIDRNKYIALDSKMKVTIKGVPYLYDEMKNIYIQICNVIDSIKKGSIFRNLQEIKDNFMTTSNLNLFGIPTRTGKLNIFLKEYGLVEISPSTLKIMDPDDIDRDKYFNLYIVPFTKSIVIDCVR